MPRRKPLDSRLCDNCGQVLYSWSEWNEHTNKCKGKNMEQTWDGKKFWVVLHADGRIPGKLKRHENKELADSEAARLSNSHRDAFLVLETVSGFQPPMQVDPVVFKE